MLFLDTLTPEDGSTAFLQNTGEVLSYQDHVPDCMNASFKYKLDISGGGGTVVIVAVLQTGKLGWNAQERQTSFSSIQHVHCHGVTPPPVQWLMQLFPMGSSCWVMNYHIPLSSAEVKNAWRYTSTLNIFMVWCLIKVGPILPFLCFRAAKYSANLYVLKTQTAIWI